MSLLDSIRAAKPLRKVGPIQHDTSAPSLINTLEITEKYDKLVSDANIENWAPALAQFTARTIQVPLSIAQGSLLRKAYETLEHATDIVEPAAAAYVTTGCLSSTLIPEETALLDALGRDIQRAIDTLSSSSDAGCFMKLSSRSPKDAAARSGVFEAYYSRAVVDPQGKLRDLDEQEKLRVLCESEGAALRFADAASVIRALILSERVWQDMTLAFRHPESWQQNIILRKWEPVPIDMEFRTFISNGRMTAISQYAYQLHSPRLNDTAYLPSVLAVIRDLYATIGPIIEAQGFERCVLDLGVIPPANNEETWRATLIEMNPFEETTDGALFSWTRERGILEGTALDEGMEYPVVRITERRRSGVLAMIPRGWKDVVEKVERMHRS
ncbi:hypothetical protein C8J57DRAFT_1177578 [Mycena rebaudengoi]|nr:hypothetical protein C8J57DRAFT_1177578 [Mycena rebaudengoi]